MLTTIQKGTTMLTNKRIATLAVTIAAAIVPSIGAQAAHATIAPVKLCHPKWVLAPNAAASHTNSPPSVQDLDVENATASGEDLFAYETVEHDDLSYNGC